MKRAFPLVVLAAAALALIPAGCTSTMTAAPEPAPVPVQETTPPPPPPGPTVQDAIAFVNMAEERILELRILTNHASWVQQNFITYDTQIIAANATEEALGAGAELAKQATRYDGLEVPAVVRRKLELLKNGLTVAAPSDPEKTEKLSKITVAMDSAYGEGKYCPEGKLPNVPKGMLDDGCLDIGEITRILAESRDPKLLEEVWKGWHLVGIPMKDEYAEFVRLANEGAGELGFADTGAMWRSKYDMPPDAFAAEMDRLFLQVKPLYDSLHCYVRWKLAAEYGENMVPAGQPIPAHLLGNLWAQDWANIYELVAPKNADPGYDLTKLLEGKKVDAIGMVRYGENFFSSLGFEPMPETFWERSLFTKPRDRNVVCHASAWNLDEVDDLRIKMCIETTAEDFQTIHHELGHNYYQRAYNEQPILFRDSANDGFHEAIGDTIALSVTPEYLKKIDLLKTVPPPSKDIGLLLNDALEKIAFLPWGLMVDKWRWQVFSGQVTPDEYNTAWWNLKRQYQGVSAPDAPRGENYFDPGAKYHIPGNTPYSRYFLAAILQFQFHRSLCEIAGDEGPLHRCSIYGSKEAGRRLNEVLEMGASRPWPEALAKLTGSGEMDATAIIDYFAPLKTWLDQQNQGKTCGW